ncbi:MAG: CPBP family intramembrane metalloprotease [Spirochaetota bacterium]|jgi:membrane protease YdiL (CAAX protease family)|nr:CPBP family intramembrane metalloprotease [Spirochaetota bacterium]
MKWKLVFIVLAFVFAGVLAVVQLKINLGFDIIMLPQFAPALAYLVTVVLFRNVYKPIICSMNKTVWIKALFAILFPLAVFTAAYCIGKLIGAEAKIGGNLFSIITTGILGILIGAAAEEIGWRSFLQQDLEQKHSVLASSAIVGLIWGVWHIGHFKNGIVFMLLFLAFTVSVSVILARILKNMRYNLIITALFHASINIGFVIFFTTGFENLYFFAIIAFVWVIIAVITVLCGRDYYCIQKKPEEVP